MLGLSKHQRKRQRKLRLAYDIVKDIATNSISSSYRWGLSRTGCDWTRLHIMKERKIIEGRG